MVAGVTFAVSAFADSGTTPEQATAAATPPAAEEPFFVVGEGLSEEELADLLDEAEERRDEAGAAGRSDGASGLTGQEDEDDEEEESEDSSSSGGSDSGGSGGGSTSPGSNRDIARNMLSDFGFGDDQWSCLDSLWEKESNWNHTAQNASSGAYGIPQSLPGSKMASSGSDWETNPATQIHWGLSYIEDRYGTPCEAWNHSQANNWY